MLSTRNRRSFTEGVLNTRSLGFKQQVVAV